MASRIIEAPNPRLYNQRSLRGYDVAVGLLSNTLAWRCPWRESARLYAASAGRRTLDVGPGSGALPAALPATTPLHDLLLLDLNPAPLAYTQRRLRHRFTCHPHTAGALSTWPLDDAGMDAVMLFDVIHCLPGDGIPAKTAVFNEAARVLAPGGVCCGRTLIGKGVHHNGLARRLLHIYNAQDNVMNNIGDTLADLHRVLTAHFAQVRTRVRGSAVLWQARKGEAR